MLEHIREHVWGEILAVAAVPSGAQMRRERAAVLLGMSQAEIDTILFTQGIKGGTQETDLGTGAQGFGQEMVIGEALVDKGDTQGRLSHSRERPWSIRQARIDLAEMDMILAINRV